MSYDAEKSVLHYETRKGLGYKTISTKEHTRFILGVSDLSYLFER